MIGSDVEVIVMRDTHILIGAVESDVMVGLRESGRQSRQQDNKGKDFLHGDRFSELNINVLGAKIAILGKNQKFLAIFWSTPPIITIQAPIINGFRQMSRLDAFAAIEVGDGTGDLKDAVVGTG